MQCGECALQCCGGGWAGAVTARLGGYGHCHFPSFKKLCVMKHGHTLTTNGYIQGAISIARHTITSIDA